MNHIIEEDSIHLDADYRAVRKARKPEKQEKEETRESESTSWQAVQSELDEMDGALGAVGRTAAGATGTLPDQSSSNRVRQTLFEAAKGDDVDTLAFYLADECRSLADRSFRDPETGETVLHRALANGAYRAAEFLLRTGRAADLVVAAYDENVGGQVSHRTSLHQAVEIGRLDVVQSLLAVLDNPKERKSLLSLGAWHSSVGRRRRKVTCLHIAAMKGFDKIVKHLVKKCGVDVNEVKECKDTALMWASLEGRQSTVARLIKLHADVNAANDQGSTALHYAIRNRHSDVVRLLLEQGQANANARRNRGLELPLILAAAMGSADIVSLLLTHGAEVNKCKRSSETALHYAASEGHLEVCQLLVDAGAEIDKKDSIDETPLLEAAKSYKIQVVSYLLSKEASITAVTKDGHSAWTYALDSDDDSMLDILLTHASKNFMHYEDTAKSRLSLQLSARIKLPNSILPLHTAAKKGDIKRLHKLLSSNFFPDDRDASGNTFVHAAAAAGKCEVLKDPDVIPLASYVNSEGRTPLHLACRLAHGESVATLAKITQLDIRSTYGSTVLHEAVRASINKDCLSAVEHIIYQLKLGRYWSLLDATDDHGNTALHLAVKYGCKEVLQKLRLLSLLKTDRDGNTPLHLAAASGNFEVFAELLRLYSRDVHEAFQKANASNMTPLRLAILHDRQVIIEHAIHAGADVAAIESDRKTVLHWIADKTTADESRIEAFMQSVKTITDNSVAWWAIKKKQQMPDYPSTHYDEMKILSLKDLFGAKDGIKSFTVLQYAASIGCLPLCEHVVNLTDLFNCVYDVREDSYAYDVTNFTPGTTYYENVCKKLAKCDVTNFATHTVTNKSRNFGNNIVFPENGVTASHEEIERSNRLDNKHENGTVSRVKQVPSILELVVANRNAKAAAELLSISPLYDLAKPYWHWYQWMWATGFVLHAVIISLLTAYGVQNINPNNETNASEASSLSFDCLRFKMPRTVICTILLYVICMILILLTSFSRIIYHECRHAITRCIKMIQGNSNASSSNGKWHIDFIGELIWKPCGLTFACATVAGLSLNPKCIPHQDYLLSTAILCGWVYSIYFLTRLRVLYLFSLMLQRVLGDCLRFFVVFMFVLFAFSFAQHVAIQPFDRYAHQYVSETTFITFQWLIGMSSFWNIDVPSDDENFRRYVFLALLYTAYIGMCTLVLMNLLIATMTDSFVGVRNNSAQLWQVHALRQTLKMQTLMPQRWLPCLDLAAEWTNCKMPIRNDTLWILTCPKRVLKDS